MDPNDPKKKKHVSQFLDSSGFPGLWHHIIWVRQWSMDSKDGRQFWSGSIGFHGPAKWSALLPEQRLGQKASAQIRLKFARANLTNLCNLQNLQNLLIFDTIWHNLTQFTTCQTFVEIVWDCQTYFHFSHSFCWHFYVWKLSLWFRVSADLGSLRLRLWRAEIRLRRATCDRLAAFSTLSVVSTLMVPWRGGGGRCGNFSTKWHRKMAWKLGNGNIGKWSLIYCRNIGKWTWHLWFWRWNDFKWDILMHFVHIRQLALRDAAN